MTTEITALDTLCADALTRLPAHDELVALVARLLPGAVIEFSDENASRAGDSIAQRNIDAQVPGGLRLLLSADWLDRRESDGSTRYDTPFAPRGFVDVRVYLRDPAITAENDKLRRAGKRKGLRRDELKSIIARGATAQEALDELLRLAAECGWRLAPKPAPRLALVAMVA